MDLSAVIQVIRTHPFVDIEKIDGGIVRKHMPTSELSESTIRSYGAIYGDIRLVPKKLMGNAPLRLESEAIVVPKISVDPVPAPLPFTGLTGLGSPYQPQAQPATGENVYKILYERANDEAKEYKRKYEDTLTELRKLEVEHAGSKGNVLGDIAQGLAGVAPLLIGKGAAGLGEAPSQPVQQQPAVSPVKDKRLVNIVTYYNRLGEDGKQQVYELLALVFSEPGNAERAIRALNGEIESDEEQESYPN